MRDWLKNARTSQRLTQKQMADAIGVTEAYFSMIESGERQKKMDLSLCVRIANTLGMSLEEIARMEEGNDRQNP